MIHCIIEGCGQRRLDLADGLAASTSILCLVHCLGLPLLVLALPGAIALGAHGEWVHGAALALIVPLALVALWGGYLQHRRVDPALLGTAGVAALIAALVWGHGSPLETWGTVAGSALLMAGHWRNWRLRMCLVGSPSCTTRTRTTPADGTR